MNIRVFQKGFNYSQDGTGNRLVYHLQGCNMRCLWCANPEGLDMNETLIVNNDLLVDSVCPYQAIHQKKLDRSKCQKCKSFECITKNKNMGIRRSYEEYEIDSVVNEALLSSALFFNGGGVTLTGGEPTMQFEAVKELLEKLKNTGINTAIETNASHPKLETLFPLIDQLIMDFKHYDNEIHIINTGIGNSMIKSNIEKAFKLHKNVHIRIPIIKGYNDSDNDIINFIKFFKQYKTSYASFEFLPYHEYSKEKWNQCGLSYLMEDAFIEPDTLSKFENMFEANNLLVVKM